MLAARDHDHDPASARRLRELLERVEILEEENRQLREQAEPLVLFPRSWRLSKSEARLLRILMHSRSGYMSQPAIYDKMYSLDGEADPKIVRTWISSIRSKLAYAKVPVEIVTVWGEGYGLTPESRAIIADALAAMAAGRVP